MVSLGKDPPPATLVRRESQANNINGNGEEGEEEEEEGERNESGEESSSFPPSPQLLMDSLTASLKKVSTIHNIAETFEGQTGIRNFRSLGHVSHRAYP